jgi:hypothetical protein
MFFALSGRVGPIVEHRRVRIIPTPWFVEPSYVSTSLRGAEATKQPSFDYAAPKLDCLLALAMTLLEPWLKNETLASSLRKQGPITPEGHCRSAPEMGTTRNIDVTAYGALLLQGRHQTLHKGR